MEIKDSGERREFSTGAVRDIADGKGRCDLLPLGAIAPLMPKQEYANILHHIHLFMQAGYDEDLYRALGLFAAAKGWSIPKMLLEVSRQYEEGAIKYGEHNWEKGIPLHCYIDSAVRHFLKYVDEWDDEPHDRAFVWNLLGAIWTYANLPEMVDIYFPQRIVCSDDDGADCKGSSPDVEEVKPLDAAAVESIVKVLSNMEPNTTVAELLKVL